MAIKKTLRAAGYCRTSGEGQRDNTSIPTQIEGTKAAIERNGWTLHHIYVDECKSGAKIDGREDFQQLMADAAAGKFDVFVPYNTTRAGRDGVDILTSAKMLKNVFGVITVSADGQYDNRSHHNTLTNFVQVGVSEHEKITTLERTIGGRIRRAKEGLPWAGNAPRGRAFVGKRDARGRIIDGKWIITERGERLRALLERYADGEQMGPLVKEFGFSSPQYISQCVRIGQLSGTYVVTFDVPEVGVNNLEVEVPAIPEVITPELERRVRARLTHNKTWNKQTRKRYLLTGFVRCAGCGKALTGQYNGNHVYYRHPRPSCDCFASIAADELEPAVLDYLYRTFLDKPAFDAAVKAAMPSADDRKALTRERRRVDKRLRAVGSEINRLVDAVAKGVDPAVLIDKQGQLRGEQDALSAALRDVDDKLGTMPDAAILDRQAQILRIMLYEKYKRRDWRNLDHDDIRKFLHVLFGDDPKREGHGIFVDLVDDRWTVTFDGRVEISHSVINGHPVTPAFRRAAAAYNRQIAAVRRSVKPQTDNWLLLIPCRNCRPACPCSPR